MTGRRILPFDYYQQHDPVQMPGWHPLFFEDVTLAETLHEAGYATALIADILHFTRPGRNFHRGYRYFDWVRGQSFDYYATMPHRLPEITDVVPEAYLEKFSPFSRADLRWEINQGKLNMRRWLQDGESLIEITARKVIAWLKENHGHKPFFLHMEAFDPHEPWDPPRRFLDKYMPNAKGPTWATPPYDDVEVPEEGVKTAESQLFCRNRMRRLLDGRGIQGHSGAGTVRQLGGGVHVGPWSPARGAGASSARDRNAFAGR